MSYALITGASSGIGLELARLFASDRINTILVARRSERLEAISENLEKEYGIRCLPISSDLTGSDAAADIYQVLSSKEISVDFLVNNAGSIVYGPFSETEWKQEKDMIRLHIESLTYMTKLFVKDMIVGGHGRVLNICSTGSFVPGPYNAVYCATKSYILSFSEAISEELRGSGITVTALCPGGTRTDFHGRVEVDGKKSSLFSAMDADVVARIGYSAMKKGKCVVIPGLTNKMQVFVTRFLPRLVTLRALKSMMSSYKLSTIYFLFQLFSMMR